jgi:hypothetical protein
MGADHHRLCRPPPSEDLRQTGELMDAARRRRAACPDVLREAEQSGDVHLARQAKTLLDQGDAAVAIAEQHRNSEGQGSDAHRLLKDTENSSIMPDSRYRRPGDGSRRGPARRSGRRTGGFESRSQLRRASQGRQTGKQRGRASVPDPAL